MTEPNQTLDEIKDLQHRLHESIHRNAKHTEKILELQNRIIELESQLRWTPFIERQPDEGEECLIEEIFPNGNVCIFYEESYVQDKFTPMAVKTRWAKVPPRTNCHK